MERGISSAFQKRLNLRSPEFINTPSPRHVRGALIQIGANRKTLPDLSSEAWVRFAPGWTNPGGTQGNILREDIGPWQAGAWRVFIGPCRS